MFPGVYTASILAGEKSGNLEQVIRRYVAYVKVVASVRRRTISALVYPAILMALSVVVVSIIMLRVVPAFSGFYAQFGQELPLSTRVIVSISDFAGTYFLAMVAGIGLLAAGVYQWLQRPGERERVDRMMLRIPFLGGIAQKFATTQAARTLATLLGGGIPLGNALEIASRSTGNRHIGKELEIVATRVREGQGFASTLLERQTVPDVAIKMIEVGESTGSLTEMLNSLADFYDEEIDTEVARFVTIIEPAMLVFMGVVIAGIVLALYLPLFNLTSVIGNT